MAKENYISLRGQLRAEPKIIQGADGNDTLAMFPLVVIRRNIYNRAGNLDIKWDRPIIASSDREMIKQIRKASIHDIVEIKGTFRTQYSKKDIICPECGEVNTIDCSIQTINPVFVGILNNQIHNDTEGQKYLLDCAEVANIAKVIGRVCTPDEDIYFAENDTGSLYARYQLAVNRKLYIKDSEGEEDHADFPVVYSYDDIAKADKQIIKQNTLVYLDGYVHTMIYDQPIECTSCGNNFTYKSQKMNLTPYAMEYLRDFDELLESTHGSKNDPANNDPEQMLQVDKES